MLELIETGQWQTLISFITIRVMVIILCWGFMSLACLIDLWDARKTAIITGEKLESAKYRRSITKMGDYARVLLFTLMFDAMGMLLVFYSLPFATMVCTASILAIEGKSMIEHSARKKSSAADIPEMVRQIIKAANTRDAQNIIDMLNTKKEGKDE